MKTTRVATLAAVLAGAALGLAAPASAELLDGTYEQRADKGGTTTWVFTSCGAGCKRAASGDIIHDYHLNGNTWTWTDPDTQFHTVMAIDNDTLAAVLTSYLQGSPVTAHFQLTKIG